MNESMPGENVANKKTEETRKSQHFTLT